MPDAVVPPVDLSRPKLIVIHGWGSSFLDAMLRVQGLQSFPCAWQEGAFILPKRISPLVRRLLDWPEPDELVRALQTLVVSRLLEASLSAGATSIDTPVRLDEERLLADFGTLGLPVGPGARLARARQLQAEATDRLTPLVRLLHDLVEVLDGPGIDGSRQPLPGEEAIRSLIGSRAAASGFEGDLVALLEAIRDMGETGGDLDTLASAVFYTHWLCAAARAAGAEARYGVEYRYVFVNYHEGLRGLAAYGPGDILLADFPVGALPDLPGDLEYLAARDVRLARLEDHHPYTEAQQTMLEGLRAAGRIGFLAMSGPREGAEAEVETPLCGADMVHQNLLAGTDHDCPGARTLRAVAHAEDFPVAERPELGRVLTDLIKGGACKIELAQLLVESLAGDDAAARLGADRWAERLARERSGFEAVADSLLENLQVFRLQRPPRPAAEAGGPALGEGSDMPEAVRAAADADKPLTVLVALAARTAPGQPRLPVGRAMEFYRQEVPEADYAFYCYGASLLVARRLNQADLSLNLGALMPEIGAPGDGGHAGAAVGRPADNPAFPRRLLAYVGAHSFPAFARYLAGRLAAAGHPVLEREDRSRPGEGNFRGGGGRLGLLVAAAVLLGLVLLGLRASYRPDAARASNRDFFPQFELDGAGPDAGGRP